MSRASVHLTNEDTRVRLDLERGGRIGSLRVDDLELLVGSEAPESESANPFLWGCYPMAPWAGRVRDGRFEWHGVEHRLELGMPPHAIHGCVFDCAWQVSASTESSAVLETRLGSRWPFAGRVVQRIALARRELRLELEVHSDAEVFPASLGWHPWFRRQLERGEPAELEFAAASMYVRDAAGIPTGELTHPAPRPWDDCFTDLESNPVIRWPAALEVELSSSTRHWVVYDMPEHALCVEPQTAPPDVFNLESEEAARVSPDAPLVAQFGLRWRPLD